MHVLQNPDLNNWSTVKVIAHPVHALLQARTELGGRLEIRIIKLGHWDISCHPLLYSPSQIALSQSI